MTEPRTPGEHRLAQLAEPEKDVAAGTKTVVLGPYLTRKRRNRSDSDKGEDVVNPRPVDARLDEATGLAAAIDLQVIHSLIVPLAAPRPATYIGSGKVDETCGPDPGRRGRPRRDGLRPQPGPAAKPGKGLGRQGHRPHRPDPGNLRTARPHQGGHAPGRAGASLLPEEPARPILDPSRAAAGRLRVPRRPGRNPDRGRPSDDPGTDDTHRARARDA